MPSSMIIPELGCRDVRVASEWLAAAFGFTTRLIIGNHRIQMAMRYGEATGDLVLVESADPAPPAASVRVRVEDVDSHCERARRHGARVLDEPTDHPYGERQYNVVDPEGHRWTFSQTLADVDPRTWGGRIPTDAGGRFRWNSQRDGAPSDATGNGVLRFT